MGILTLFMIAVGLSMDAFAVSVTSGMCNKSLSVSKSVYIAAVFGIFQGLMPTAGFLAGSAFAGLIGTLDHWIALILLGLIGGKMIHDSFSHEEDEVPELFSYKLVLAQGVATSIDALAVGVSFAAMRVNILQAAPFIAVVTFVCSLVGVYVGKCCGGFLKNKAELFGGCVLVLIGVKIFVEHMFG
ncbi:MAG: manganese efflux pump [Clostridiales bacterium]|uniref:Putative manganese efflux pump MntP n=1 Tax=Harryflintia acetispora TaxID=1849041 RepID=A0A9X8UJY5_9FIRM|nr:MAG: manganese efflux pump [Clostridiales bacterium]RGB67895.1 manganese efflux pump [Harryflintia acetispora]TCL43418.1 putative Mn2+ efflux pump MntP [Harryflintia acetispora]